MARPPLPVGTSGKITFASMPSGQVQARCKVRDPDGVVREVARHGPSRSAAERRLKEALRDRRGPTSGDSITGQSTFAEAAQMWQAEAESADLAESTVETYKRNLKLHVLPALGQLRLREITVGTVDRFLKTIRQRNGPGAAKNTKKVVSLVLGLAVRHDALVANPVRDVAKIKRGRRSGPRALTVAETADFLERVVAEAGADPEARRSDETDLAKICEFMLGTGVRIGEALAVRRDVVDLEAGVIEVDATVIRPTGKGAFIQYRTKSDAGWRVIAVPDDIVELLRRRFDMVWPRNELGLAFPTAVGGVRNPVNVQRGIRTVRKRLDDYGWVTSHVFRKTVATRLDEAGLSARAIADHLGHAQPSMTQDVYMGRGVVTAEAATVLARKSGSKRGVRS